MKNEWKGEYGYNALYFFILNHKIFEFYNLYFENSKNLLKFCIKAKCSNIKIG